jgi:hypothetical protein
VNRAVSPSTLAGVELEVAPSADVVVERFELDVSVVVAVVVGVVVVVAGDAVGVLGVAVGSDAQPTNTMTQAMAGIAVRPLLTRMAGA